MNRLNQGGGEWLRLNLVFAPALEGAVTQALATDAMLAGFTLVQAQAHSHDFAHASLREKVRGRLDRRLLWVVMERARLDEVVALLRARVASDSVQWWAEPVIAGGSLA